MGPLEHMVAVVVVVLAAALRVLVAIRDQVVVAVVVRVEATPVIPVLVPLVLLVCMSCPRIVRMREAQGGRVAVVPEIAAKEGLISRVVRVPQVIPTEIFSKPRQEQRLRVVTVAVLEGRVWVPLTLPRVAMEVMVAVRQGYA